MDKFGNKTGGRTKGTPNKRTLALRERLAELDCDPFEVLASIATNTEEETPSRIAACKELLKYTEPVPKPVELDDQPNLPMVIIQNIGEDPDENAEFFSALEDRGISRRNSGEC